MAAPARSAPPGRGARADGRGSARPGYPHPWLVSRMAARRGRAHRRASSTGRRPGGAGGRRPRRRAPARSATGGPRRLEGRIELAWRRDDGRPAVAVLRLARRARRRRALAVWDATLAAVPWGGRPSGCTSTSCRATSSSETDGLTGIMRLERPPGSGDPACGVSWPWRSPPRGAPRPTWAAPRDNDDSHLGPAPHGRAVEQRRELVPSRRCTSPTSVASARRSPGRRPGRRPLDWPAFAPTGELRRGHARRRLRPLAEVDADAARMRVPRRRRAGAAQQGPRSGLGARCASGGARTTGIRDRSVPPAPGRTPRPAPSAPQGATEPLQAPPRWAGRSATSG